MSICSVSEMTSISALSLSTKMFFPSFNEFLTHIDEITFQFKIHNNLLAPCFELFQLLLIKG